MEDCQACPEAGETKVRKWQPPAIQIKFHWKPKEKENHYIMTYNCSSRFNCLCFVITSNVNNELLSSCMIHLE